MTRHLALLLLIGFVVAITPAPAWGCSCIAPDAEEMLASHEFAFVGSLIDKRPVGQGQFGGEAIYTFQVSGWAKGNLGETVDVRSADNGAACGFELAPGHEAAIFVSKVNGGLSGGLCSTMDAASLDAVADLMAPIIVDTAPPPGDATPPAEPEPSAPVALIWIALPAIGLASAFAIATRRRRQGSEPASRA